MNEGISAFSDGSFAGGTATASVALSLGWALLHSTVNYDCSWTLGFWRKLPKLFSPELTTSGLTSYAVDWLELSLELANYVLDNIADISCFYSMCLLCRSRQL